jgi:hypothetical protein
MGFMSDDLYDQIRPRDRVTIVDRFGSQRTGRAVMLGPAGWVLNMGGPHGTPAIATPKNVVDVRKSKTRLPKGAIGGSFAPRRSSRRSSRRSRRSRRGDTRGFNRYDWKVGDQVRRKAAVKVGADMIGEVVKVTPTLRNHLMSDGVSRAQVRVRWSNGYEGLVPEGGLVRA